MPRSKSPNGAGTCRPRQLADGTTVYDISVSYRDPDGLPQRKAKKGFPSLREANQYRRVGGHEKLPGDGHEAARWRT